MNNQTQPPPAQGDNRFIVAVGVLLLLIVALLAGLWIRASRRAQRAEQRVVTLSRQQSQAAGLLQQAMREHIGRATIRREELATRKVTLAGRQISALVLPAGQADRLGLRAGDVILVDKLPTTATGPTALQNSRTPRSADPADRR